MNLFLLLFLQLLVIASVILILYRMKPKISLAPLFIFLGSIQYAQHILASSLYFILWGEVTISTGSSIFFASSLFAILLIYIKEGIPQTRTLIVGIFISNISLTLLGAITNLAVVSFKGSISSSVPSEFFEINYLRFLVGTLTLLLDVFLLVIIYQFLVVKAKILNVFGGILASLILTLYFDALTFSIGGFYGTPQFQSVLIGQLIGKSISGALFGLILYFYLRYIDEFRRVSHADLASETPDVFSILTYREKFQNLDTRTTKFERKLSEELISTLDQMSDYFLSVDDQWRFTYLNKVASAYLKKSRSELVGKNIWKEFPEVVETPFYENCYVAMAMGEQFEVDHFDNRNNKWFHLKFIPSKQGLSLFFNDITESVTSAATIKKAQLRNEALLKSLPDLLFVINNDGIFVDYHNPHDRETIVEPEKYIGKSVFEILPHEMAEETMRNIAKSLSSGEIIEHFYNLELQDGIHYFEARYAKNNETEVVTVIRDVTAETKIERDLIRSESKYRSLIEQASDGILVHDMSGNLLEMNQAGLEYSGYSRSEVEGFSIADFLFLEDLKDLPIPFERLKNGETTGTRRRIKRKDGTAIWMDVRSKMNDEGNVIAIMRDVTERLAIEKEIIKSENRFRTLTESAPIGIFQTDMRGRVVYVNDQFLRLSGLSYNEAMGEGWVNGIFPEDRERLFVEWIESLKNARGLHSEFRMNGSDGKLVECEVRTTGLFDNNHAQFGYIGIVSDVTRQKNADAELKIYRDQLEELVGERTRQLEIEKVKAQSADKLKSAFLATMSHELRTPLNSIIGFTGLLLNELAGPINDEQKKQLGMVKNSGRHLLSLINDILDLSKIEAGELSFAKHPYDLRTSMEKIVALVKPLADSKGLELRFEIIPKDIQFVNDERRVEQIVINLLDNAVKFTDQGAIGLKCIIDDKILTIAVTDTGIGIREEDLVKLFIPFSQLDSGLTRNHQGTGLGLSISQKLVKMLGGSICVESEFGSGSTFIVRFPVNGSVV